MIRHLFNGLDILYHHAKFARDRTMRTSCRCENVVLFSCLSRSKSGRLFARVGYTLNSYFVAVYGSILIMFSPFSQVIALSESLDSSVARWRHNIREIAVKNCEKSKNLRKSLCAPLHIDS